MGGLRIDCPLCCLKTFDSKQALIEHLSHTVNNLYCPLCSSKQSSIESLTEHLSLYDCQNTESIVIYENVDDLNQSGTKNSIKTLSDELTTEDGTQFISSDVYQDEGTDVNTMYAALLSKHLSKPILKTQELKLVKEDGESRYMIVSQDDYDLNDENRIVTKKNDDGTISLTTVKEMKMETDALIAPEPDLGNNSEEVYSCNACKVSFTSVMEHIQNYHNDQEVVLEDMPPEGSQTFVESETDPLDCEDGTLSDKQAPRRVITDTGDIVEEPLTFKTENLQANTKKTIVQHAKLDKQARAHAKLSNKVVETTKKDSSTTETESSTPYHKVVTKEMQTKTGFTVKMYHCMSCNVSVANLNEFQTHPCKTLKYPCPRCPAAYENSKSLCAHMKVHKERPDGSPLILPVKFECEVCSTEFPSNKSLKLHKRMHEPVKYRPIELPTDTIDGKPPSDLLYRCTVCEKMIPYDYKTIHENSHKAGEKMTCSVCNKKFDSLEYLEMHMNVHNMEKVTMSKQDKSLPYKCLYCDRRFSRPHEKVKHERIHTGEKPHECEICGKSFRVSYCLTLHMRTHTGARPYACPHCGKRFKAHSVYNHHLLTHSEVRAYKCPFCPKAFKTSVQLAGHKNSHTKPFSCQHCNRPFASLYAVRVHSETHSRQNNLRFSCTLCGASYARAFALKDHVKQVHKQDVDAADNSTDNNQEDWVKESSDATLNKELQSDMTDLEMNANELIIS